MSIATRNTVSSKELMSIIERLERLREQKKALSDDEKVVVAEATATGFSKKRIADVLKIRSMNPHDREEAQAELDMYLHAIGMATEAPLFRQIGLMAVDLTAREQVIEAVKLLVPPSGEFIVKVGGAPVRIWRDVDGTAHAEDVKDIPLRPTSPDSRGYKTPPAVDVPDTDAAGAEQIGRAAYIAGLAIIKNPFPWDNPLRGAWDRGWRSQSGGDGMGPDSED